MTVRSIWPRMMSPERKRALWRCWRMKIQVVCCHPLTDSFDHALFRAVIDTLEKNGHGVDATDLYREVFAPAMTVEERRTMSPERKRALWRCWRMKIQV